MMEQGLNSTFRLLCDTIQTAMERFRIPGAAIGVIYEGIEYTAGFGVTNVDHPLPVDADTLFQIGSTTKTVTGTVVMRLVEEGLLDLDTPLRAYLPDLRLASEDVAAHVTMRHLLTHTGGWEGDYFADFGPGDDALSRLVATLDQLPQLTPLGTVWAYNNAGFYLAGRVVEAVTGETYEAAVRRLVLHPLDMRRSFFFAADAITYRVAVGHTIRGNEPVVARPWAIPRAHNPAGGLICGISDLLRYARFHLGDGRATKGTRLLRPESMALMQSPLAQAGNFADAVGVAWHIRDIEGTRVIEHGGGTFGQMAAFQLVPERGFAIALVANADSALALFREIVALAFERYLGLREHDPIPLEAPADQLTAYVGRYVGTDIDLEIGRQDDRLVMTEIVKARFSAEEPVSLPAPSPAHLALYSKDRIVVLDGPWKGQRAEFMCDADGSVRWLRFIGRLHARQR